MLIVGLTGGIAAGKSTVASALADAGAVVVDADRLARDALAPLTAGLSAVVDRFGPGVLQETGELDRAGLATIVFDDADARRDLEAIVHPAVAAEFEARVAALERRRPDAIVVHDVPLLVENGLAPRYHLVVVADAPERVRLERAVARGLDPDAVRARMAAQADDAERRAVADVLLDTAVAPERTVREVEELWRERLVPYERNVREQRRAPRAVAELGGEDPADPWARQAERLMARIARAGEDLLLDVAHIGSTAVPGLPAKDVIDLQVGVADLDDALLLAPRLAAAGFPLVRADAQDTPKQWAPDPARWRKTFHANADPGRAVNVHVRVTGSPGWEWALAFRDWLRADPEARERYLRVKEGVLAETADRLGEHPTHAYAAAKEPFFTAVDGELAAWRERTGWRPVP